MALNIFLKKHLSQTSTSLWRWSILTGVWKQHQDRRTLQRVVRSAGCITRSELPDLQSVYTEWCSTKARLKGPSHPDHGLFSLLRSGVLRPTLPPGYSGPEPDIGLDSLHSTAHALNNKIMYFNDTPQQLFLTARCQSAPVQCCSSVWCVVLCMFVCVTTEIWTSIRAALTSAALWLSVLTSVFLSLLPQTNDSPTSATLP